MAAIELRMLARAQLCDAGVLLPPPTNSLAVRMVEPLYLLALRHLPGGAQAIAAAMASIGIAALPGPGRFIAGHGDAMLVWRNPSEWTFVGSNAAVAAALCRALPGRDSLAYAVDQSAGIVAFGLGGSALGEILPRLIDASAVPAHAGDATRARLGDIAVTLLRLADDRAWLLADRAYDRYLARWIAYATEGAGVGFA